MLMDMNDLMFLLRSLKGRCCDNQLSLERIAKMCKLPPLFFALPFHNKFDYCNVDVHIGNGSVTSTACTNLVGSCPVSQEITRIFS